MAGFSPVIIHHIEVVVLDGLNNSVKSKDLDGSQCHQVTALASGQKSASKQVTLRALSPEYSNPLNGGTH